MRPFTYIRPQNIAQAISGKNENTQFIAGGTNLLDLMKKHIAQPETVLEVQNVLPDSIQTTADGIRIGAMARNSAVATHAAVLEHFPLVAKAILAGASPQIRNMASTAGNLMQRTRCTYFYDTSLPCNKRKPGSGCGALKGNNHTSAIIGYSEQCVAVHPSDLCIALAALDAKIYLASKEGSPIIIPFSEFHRLPGDTPWLDNNLPAKAIIDSVIIPFNSFEKNSAYVKLRDRDSYAFALVSVAAALQLDGHKITAARLASGGVAHKPWRWTAAEEFLKGRKANARSFRKAAAIIAGEVKPLAHNQFKVPMLEGAVVTALQNCLNAS